MKLLHVFNRQCDIVASAAYLTKCSTNGPIASIMLKLYHYANAQSLVVHSLLVTTKQTATEGQRSPVNRNSDSDGDSDMKEVSVSGSRTSFPKPE